MIGRFGGLIVAMHYLHVDLSRFLVEVLKTQLNDLALLPQSLSAQVNGPFGLTQT